MAAGHSLNLKQGEHDAMSTPYPTLFTPLKLRHLELKGEVMGIG